MQRTFDLPMKMEKRILRPRTSTKRSQACGHLVQAKSCAAHLALWWLKLLRHSCTQNAVWICMAQP